jgi:hypothetical protein
MTKYHNARYGPRRHPNLIQDKTGVWTEAEMRAEAERVKAQEEARLEVAKQILQKVEDNDG